MANLESENTPELLSRNFALDTYHDFVRALIQANSLIPRDLLDALTNGVYEVLQRDGHLDNLSVPVRMVNNTEELGTIKALFHSENFLLRQISIGETMDVDGAINLQPTTTAKFYPTIFGETVWMRQRNLYNEAKQIGFSVSSGKPIYASIEYALVGRNLIPQE